MPNANCDFSDLRSTINGRRSAYDAANQFPVDVPMLVLMLMLMMPIGLDPGHHEKMCVQRA